MGCSGLRIFLAEKPTQSDAIRQSLMQINGIRRHGIRSLLRKPHEHRDDDQHDRDGSDHYHAYSKHQVVCHGTYLTPTTSGTLHNIGLKREI